MDYDRKFYILLILYISCVRTALSTLGTSPQPGDETNPEQDPQEGNLHEDLKYAALILEGNSLEIADKVGEFTTFNVFACPPEDSGDIEETKKKSITKNYLVIRKTSDITKKTNKKICKYEYAPSLIWRRKSMSFETGYEIQLLDSDKEFVRDELTSEGYSLNYTEHFAEATSELSDSHGFLKKVKDVFNRSPSTFIWKGVLKIKFDTTLNITRQVKFQKKEHYSHSYECICSNYHMLKGLTYNIQNFDEFYLKENQQKIFAAFTFAPNPENSFDAKDSTYEITTSKTSSNCEPFGCLRPTQLVPSYYFDERAKQIATCTELNTIPMWESAADGQWRVLEKVLYKFLQREENVKIIAGTAGVLELPQKTKQGIERKPINLSSNHSQQTVTVPKFVYKLLTVDIPGKPSYKNRYLHAIVFIIHNDPTASSSNETICERSVCVEYGWEQISNKNHQTGLIYCCPPDEDVLQKLEMSSKQVNKYRKYGVFDLTLFPVFDKSTFRMMWIKYLIKQSDDGKYYITKSEDN